MQTRLHFDAALCAKYFPPVLSVSAAFCWYRHWFFLPFHCTSLRGTCNCHGTLLASWLETWQLLHFDGTLPSSLLASLCTYQTSRTLRSSNKKTLENPYTRSQICWRPLFQFHCPNCLEFATYQFAESPHPLWLQSSAQNVSFPTGISTNLGGP